jgi:hypothetical protein
MVEMNQSDDAQNPNEISVEVDGDKRTIDLKEYGVELDGQ